MTSALTRVVGLGRRVLHSRFVPASARRFIAERGKAVLQATVRPPKLALDAGGPCRICEAPLRPYRFDGALEPAAFDGVGALLFACDDCGHKQFLPDLTDQDLAKVYSSSYFSSDAERDLYASLYALHYNATADEIFGYLRSLGLQPPYRFHEFGCGTGLTVHHLRRYGVEATGSDWSPIAVEFGRANGNPHVFLENVNTLEQMKGEKLDVVFTNHVLEHLPDPVSFLRKLKDVLHENSIVMMRLPNGDGLADRRLGMLYDPLFYFPHHIHYFSARSLLAAGERAGLKTVDLVATTRAVPELLFAAEGRDEPLEGEALHARLHEAAAHYETEELQVAWRLPASPDAPRASVEQARARRPEPADARPSARWCNREGFYTVDPVWSYVTLDGAGAATPMRYVPWTGAYEGPGAAIGDHFLGAAPDHPSPCLVFTAPGSGRYRARVEAAARFINGPSIQFRTDAAGVVRFDARLTSSVPTRLEMTETLRAGEQLRFSAAAAPEGAQRVTLVVKIDPVP